MTYTKEQMAVLRNYERHFDTAVNGSWARFPGDSAIHTIYDIFVAATGDKRTLRASCSTCILHLLQDAGKIYFKDKAEVSVVTDKSKRKKKVNINTNGD